MADEPTAAAPVEASATVPDTKLETATEPAPTNGESAAPPEKKEDTAAAAEHVNLEAPAVAVDDAQDAEATSADAAADSATPGGGKDKKRKSLGGVPEHKNRKLNKKKSMPTLHLECKPGEMYWARLKGYPAWPAIICDESMLPESLLATRPVSTARPDGSLRDDFKEGGKNAKERTFPIMFLCTNEFYWMVNTSLKPLDPEDCKTLPKTKMTRELQEAYKIASEDHDINYFKTILRVWQEEEEDWRIQQEELAAEAERVAAEKAAQAENEPEEHAKEKVKKKAPRKSKAGDVDVDMDDAEAPKSTKKRKKDAESEGDGPKPKKTPKVTKLNAPKTPNGDASAAKKSATKTKKKVVTAPKAEDEEEKPQMTEEERMQTREKAILYLRHRLQKGFLSRDQAPKEDEMANMADFFTQLEGYDSLEPVIIRSTKIHKVLKAIVKLASVPKDDQYSFKKRSSALLEVWNKRMEADGGEAAPKPTDVKTPQTNGDQEAEKEVQKEVLDEAKNDAEEGASKPVEGQETEMQDAEATEKPAETAEEKKADEAAEKIEAKIEPKSDGPTATATAEEQKIDAEGDVNMSTAPATAEAA